MENLALMQKYLRGINPEFAKVFVEGKDKYEPFVMGKEVKLFNYETEADYVSTESEFTPYGYLPKVEVDGANRTLVDRVMGYDTSWTQEMYSKGVEVSYMAAKFGKYKEQLNAFKGLVTGAQKTKDKIAFDLLVNADTTLLADGQTLLDPAHPYPAGSVMAASTWSNVIMNGAVQAELGPEALRLAKKALMSHLLSDGTYATSGVSNLALVVGPELAELAQVFAGTDKAPLSANNDINTYKGIMKVVVSPYLSTANGGNDNMWFLADLDAVDLRIKVSEDITKTEDMDTKNLTKSYYVHEILAAKAASARGIAGAMVPGSAWS